MQKAAQQRAVIIGAGIGGLALAGMLARSGFDVTALEKNARAGGRANRFSSAGFHFDMGPSWYLMPDVFGHFFKLMGTTADQELDLIRLSPSYQFFFENEDDPLLIVSQPEEAAALFDKIEPGAGARLEDYLETSKFQYELLIENLMYKNVSSFRDFIDFKMIKAGMKLPAFSNMHRYVRRYFQSERLQKIMQYQLLFLGSSPFHAPSLYNIMGHIDFNMGVYYPKGGIYKVVEALQRLAAENGASIRVNCAVRRILTNRGLAIGVELADGECIEADIVISNADLHHTETQLLPLEDRSYSERYWKRRSLAPSALILYIGLKDRAENLHHHNILLAENWEASFRELFEEKRWPKHPSLYVCCPTKTDPSLAPPGKDILFILMPIPAGIVYDAESQAAYAAKALAMAEAQMGIADLRNRIETSRIYCGNDFASDYNSFQGSALGLAHTLNQTAIFRPANVSRNLPNLFFAGAGVNPGIGVPSCLISAELAYKRILGIKTAAPLEALVPNTLQGSQSKANTRNITKPAAALSGGNAV